MSLRMTFSATCFRAIEGLSVLKRFVFSMSLMMLCLVLLACDKNSNSDSDDVSGAVKVQIPFSFNGDYRLQTVELFTLENISKLRGLAARFLIDPDSRHGNLEGREPQIRYVRTSSGLVVPKDSLSLQLLTVYAHFEKIRELDQKLKVSAAVTWPATVAVNAQYKGMNDTAVVNNALYSGQLDALLLVPYTAENLPLMVNAGVLAHEHFHRIFQKSFIDAVGADYPVAARVSLHGENEMLNLFGLSDPGPSVEEVQQPEVTEEQIEEQGIDANYHLVYLRALNEGFADVWGWVYSGDDLFVGRSLPQQQLARKLDVKISGLESANNLRSIINQHPHPEDLVGFSYYIGTQYARMFREFANQLIEHRKMVPVAARMKVGEIVLKILPGLAERLKSLKRNQYLQASDVVDLIHRNVTDLNSEECFYFANLISKTERDSSTSEYCEKIQAKETQPALLQRGPGQIVEFQNLIILDK